jgi:hypothetical protein
LQKSLTPSFRRKPSRRSGTESFESRSERDWIPGHASLARNEDFSLLSRVLQESQNSKKLNVSSTENAEMAMVIDIMHTITWKTAWMYDQKRSCTKEASYLKLFSRETAQKIMVDAILSTSGPG